MDAVRFDDLLERYQSGEATPAEMAELERLLRDDAELRRRFVERTLLEVQLYKAFAGLVADTTPVPARRWHPRRWLAAAVVLLALGAGAIFVFTRQGEQGVEVASGAVLLDNRPVTRLPEGEQFEVGSSVAVLLLPDRSRAELDPATQGIVRGKVGEVRQVIELTRGGGVFQVAHGGGQFRVDTPLGKVTALGTEFTIKLKRTKSKRTLAVAVAAGTVEVVSNGKRRVLAAGERRLYGDDGEQNNNDDGEQNNNNNDDGNK